MKKLLTFYVTSLIVLFCVGVNCSNTTQQHYKQNLVKYTGPLIENVTFNCDLSKRLHFDEGAVLRHCIFKWNGAVDVVWCPEFTSRNMVAVLTGSNVTLDECMFYGSGLVNPQTTLKQ